MAKYIPSFILAFNGNDLFFRYNRMCFRGRRISIYFIMSNEINSPLPALKFEVTVQEHGHVEFSVPYSAGAKLAVFVVEENDTVSDLIAASQSSLDFWDNSFDDEDWNDAATG